MCVILKMNTEFFHIFKKQNMRFGYMHKILTMKHLSRKIPKYSAPYIMIHVPSLVFMWVTPLRPSRGRGSSMKSKWNDDWQGRKNDHSVETLTQFSFLLQIPRRLYCDYVEVFMTWGWHIIAYTMVWHNILLK